MRSLYSLGRDKQYIVRS